MDRHIPLIAILSAVWPFRAVHELVQSIRLVQNRQGLQYKIKLEKLIEAFLYFVFR